MRFPVRLLLGTWVGLLGLQPMAMAQDVPPGLKSWYLGGLTVRVTPKTSFRLSQLYAFDARSHRFQFVQNGLSATFRFSKRYRGTVSVSHMALRGST